MIRFRGENKEVIKAEELPIGAKIISSGYKEDQFGYYLEIKLIDLKGNETTMELRPY